MRYYLGRHVKIGRFDGADDIGNNLTYPELLQAVVEEGQRQDRRIDIGYQHEVKQEQLFIPVYRESNPSWTRGLILTPPKEEPEPKRVCATCEYSPSLCAYPLVAYGSCKHWKSPKEETGVHSALKKIPSMSASEIEAFCEKKGGTS